MTWLEGCGLRLSLLLPLSLVLVFLFSQSIKLLLKQTLYIQSVGMEEGVMYKMFTN